MFYLQISMLPLRRLRRFLLFEADFELSQKISQNLPPHHKGSRDHSFQKAYSPKVLGSSYINC